MKTRRIEFILVLFAVFFIGLVGVGIANAATVVTVTTDKPTYGRGALVGISGVVTSDGSPSSGRTIGIEIHKPSAALLALLFAETGSDGVYSAFFQLSGTADYGTYQIIVAVSGTDIKGSGSFQVAASPPPDTTPPVISNVAASGITSTSATVEWTTDEPANSQVEYGTTASYGSTTPLGQTLDVSHSTALSGLTPSTTYHFRVGSSDGAGNPAQSGDNTFTTLAQTSSTSTISTSSTSTTSATSTSSSTSTTSSSSTSTESTFTSTSTPEFNGNLILLVALAAASTIMINHRNKRAKEQDENQ